MEVGDVVTWRPRAGYESPIDAVGIIMSLGTLEHGIQIFISYQVEWDCGTITEETGFSIQKIRLMS